MHKHLALAALLIAIIPACSETAPPATTKPPAETQDASQQEFNLMLEKAEAGDAEAQAKLGLMYAEGKGVAKDAAKAVEWFRKAAEAGSAKGQAALGWMYDDGEGVARDAAKAAEWYRKSAEQGNRFAQLTLGLKYTSGDGVSKDAAKAAEWYRKAAEQGDQEAQFNLGRMYEVGEGVTKDEAKAVEWYEKGVEQGDPNAQVALGSSYLFGNGAAKDVSKAAELYLKAADQGNASAQFFLGWIHENGIGVTQDTSKAVHWYEKAAVQGNDQVQAHLGWIYEQGEGVAKNASKAVEWYRKAAEFGNQKAQFNTGLMYLHGEGVAVDLVLAYAWFNLAAISSEIKAEATEMRDKANGLMSRTEVQEAQRLSSDWKKGESIVRETEATASLSIRQSTTPILSKKSAGTGFAVTPLGQAVTNHHVVNGCVELRIPGRDGAAKVITHDSVNDLALIQLPGKFEATVTLARNPQNLRQGNEVIVFGFPLSGALSSGGNLTPGVISALTGLGNNTNQIQITAPIQPGSSGSPVLNKDGEVVGVVSMKLSDSKMAAATGSIGQNVNFAVSGLTLKTFLDTHNVDYRTGSFISLAKSTADLADEARKWTFVVECWN